MEPGEIAQRVRHLARLFAAWPGARVTSVDLTLLEYVNATRGVPLDVLPTLVQAVIDAGGEFLPPAGTLLERAARLYAERVSSGYHPALSPEERRRDALHDGIRTLRSAHCTVEPVAIEAVARALVTAGSGHLAAESGR